MNANFETLNVTRDDAGIISLELARPDKRNAMSGEMISELTQFAKSVGADKTARAVILSGQGSVFCAGGDLGWMQQQIQADRPQRMAQARKLAEMLFALNTMPLPLIGRVHGGAFGGGVGLCSVCDVVIAAQETKFAFTETRLGLIPATISPYVLAKMGERNARHVFMSSRVFTAKEAVDLSLVSDVVDMADLAERVQAEIDPYLSVAPGAVAASKSLARSLGPRIDLDVIEDTIIRLADTWETEEASHGIAAFLNKTKPRWA